MDAALEHGETNETNSIQKVGSNMMKISVYLSLLIAATALAETPPDLQPLMAMQDKIALRDDFSKDGPIDKAQWGARQGTRWAIKDGALHGQPSTKEFQDLHKDHKGYEPRVASSATPAQFVAKFSVRFTNGSETAIVPFVEFGHHVCRLRFSSEGTEMVVDHESTRVAEAKDFKYEPGKWHHFLAELKGDEVVVQIAGGPTFYAKHACFVASATSGADGLGIAGPKDGHVEIDNVTMWTVKADTQANWATKRDKMPKFEQVIIEKKKPAKNAK